MAGEQLIFDATASNVDGTDPGTPVEVGPNDDLRLREFDAPAPPQTVTYAGSVDTEGSVPASRKHENRLITLRILCNTAASLRSLQGKVGKIAREGGTLKWTLPNSETVIFDLLAADSFEPRIDAVFYARAGTYCEVVVTLPAKPYGRGAEVDLGDNTETTLPALVFTDTGVKGDWYGLGRLVIDNDDASNAQRFLLWGIQSRYYSADSTAALFYQAESCALSSATVATGPSGASGGVSNNTAFYGSLPVTGGSWHALIYIGASSTAQTHIGKFRVFVRAQVPIGNSGVVSLRVSWNPEIGRSDVINDYVSLTNSGGVVPWDSTWLLVDLGEITLPKARTGTQGWLGSIDGSSTVLNDDVYLDWVMLVPVDEGSGQAVAPSTIVTSIEASGSVHVRHDSVLTNVTGGYRVGLEGYEGDYLLVPPSGAEARTLRTIVKFSRGAINEDWGPIVGDGGTDDISARLFVTPRYLVVPEP